MKQDKPNQHEDSPSQAFTHLPLRDALLTNLASLDYETMTPIQAQSLPMMLQGNDVIAQAKTGSGKTVAFGLSLLNRLNTENYAVQALILCPTRELAEQVSQVLRRLARLMPNIKILNLSGGIPMRPQLDSLRHGAHIIVGTPGRVQKHLTAASLKLDQLQVVVLDEADRMLDMGFLDDMRAILTQCPKHRQTLLFSATYPAEIKTLAREFMRDPKEVVVTSVHTELDIQQRFYEVNRAADKLPLLKALLLHHQPSSTLIFCNTKQQTAELATWLTKEGFSALALHGDMEQTDRDLAMVRFSNHSCSMLVATDVAARGLDIKELDVVINFELAFEQDVHIHRIGRTGRAGHKGLALSLTMPADAERICAIEDNLTQPLIWGTSSELSKQHTSLPLPEMVTFCLSAGRKDKIRPGDILGALTKDAGLPGNAIGKINITTLQAFVAIHQSHAQQAYHYFQHGKLKGRKINVRKW